MYGTVKEVIERLSKYKNQDEQIGAIIWHHEDVISAVEHATHKVIDVSLAKEALKIAITAHDGNNGVSHETLVDTVSDIISEREGA